MVVKVKRLRPDAKLPEYQTPGAAGADVYALLDDPLPLTPGQVVAVPTGLQVEIPQGWELQVRPRSGLAFNHSLLVPNSPGTIDSDYRGELKVLLLNASRATFIVEPGMRIAQLVLSKARRASFEWAAKELSETMRGTGGFGSTGVTHARALSIQAPPSSGSAQPALSENTDRAARNATVPMAEEVAPLSAPVVDARPMQSIPAFQPPVTPALPKGKISNPSPGTPQNRIAPTVTGNAPRQTTNAMARVPNPNAAVPVAKKSAQVMARQGLEANNPTEPPSKKGWLGKFKL